jgi:molybdate-binding protein
LDNVDLAQQTLIGFKIVLLKWTQHAQRMMAATGHPHNVHRLTDLRERGKRLIGRHQVADSYLLLSRLLEAVGLRRELRLIGTIAHRDYLNHLSSNCWRLLASCALSHAPRI